MRKITSVFLLFMGLHLFLMAQPTEGSQLPQGKPGVDYNAFDSKGRRQGLWVQQWKTTGHLLYRGTYQAGVPTGEWQRYYMDGKLMAVSNHVKDTTIVDVSFYYNDGKTKMSEGRYLKKKKDGIWLMWGENGLMLSEETYKDSLLHGPCKYFYPDGKLLKTENYKKGIKDGPFTEYFGNGKKRMEGSFVAGSFDGPFKAWYSNGLLEREGEYKKGLQNGAWYYYLKTGLPQMSVHYQNDRIVRKVYINGTFKEEYDSGIVKSEYTYEDGKKDGPFTEWYDMGQYVEEPVTDKTQLEMGIVKKQVLRGTQIKMQGDYVKDKLEGEVIHYNEKGKVIKVESWKDGVLVGSK